MTTRVKLLGEAAAIEADLKAVNGKAKTFTVTTADEVERVAILAEERLERSGVPASMRVGTTAVYTSEGPGRGYKYKAPVTIVMLVRRKGGWRVTEVKRGSAYGDKNAREHLDLTVSAEVADRIRQNAMRGFAEAAA